MGRLAYLAESHWREHLPAAYASITDRAAFFQELEDEAAEQIDELMESLLGPEPLGETYLQRAGRFRMARFLAEEMVLAEVLMPRPEMRGQVIPERTADAALRVAFAEFHTLRNELP